jgi:hypothetical protein
MRQLVVIIGLLWPFVAGAQQERALPLPIEPGDSLRVGLRSGLLVPGTFIRQTADSVAIQHALGAGQADTTFAFADLATVEAKSGHHTAASALAGLSVGFLAGLVTGGALGLVSAQGCHSDFCGFGIIILPPVFGVAGGVIGLVIGAGRTIQLWEIVWRSVPAGAGA